ncbi:MAG: mechanosensitive ion channel family protein [Proteobacteria bacterium]|nr:mechanosensitive ion channel family protein [Pseudomonadota bacterium]
MSFESIQEWFDIAWFRFVVAAGGGLLAGLFISNLVGTIAKRTRNTLVSDSAARLSALIFVLCLVLGLRFGLESFELEPDTKQLLGKIFVIIIYVLVTWGITRFYDVVHEQILQPWGRRQENIAIIDVLRTVAIVIIWMLGVLSAVNSAGYNVSAVLAGLGIGGLAVALAAQDTVANLFGGVIILTQNPFKVGDKITIGGNTGWVLSIGIRSSVIENWYGHKITVPNKVFTDGHVINVDARTVYWEGMQLKLRHDSTLEQIERAMALVQEVLDRADNLTETTWVGLCNIGEGYVELEVWYGIEKFAGSDDSYPNEYMKILGVKTEVNVAVLRAFEEASIHLAMPLQRHIVSQSTPAALPESRF